MVSTGLYLALHGRPSLVFGIVGAVQFSQCLIACGQLAMGLFLAHGGEHEYDARIFLVALAGVVILDDLGLVDDLAADPCGSAAVLTGQTHQGIAV
jgi:hypothetical protein